MIEKFLMRFCAPEVRTMVTRLHERPDDFTYGSKWRDLAEMRQGFTWAERKVLDKEWDKFKKNQKRREMLNLITKEVIDPTPRARDFFSDSYVSQIQSQQQAHMKMQIAQMNAYTNNQAMSGYTDPRALYQGGNRNV